MSLLTYVILLLLVISSFRMFSRIMLFRKIGWSTKKALIPVVSHISISEKLGLKNQAIICSICRIVGVVLVFGTIIVQYYLAQYYMSHFYGIMLGNYTVPDYSAIWNILSTAGALIGALGIAGRLLVCKKFSRLFGCHNKIVDAIGMVFPSIYELYFACSQKYMWLMQRPTHQMTSEEYAMYCAMID